MGEKTWAVQGSGPWYLREPRRTERGGIRPCRCSDEDARRAYAGYKEKYTNDQSFETLMDRGGFGPGEMDMFAPGWTRIENEKEEE